MSDVAENKESTVSVCLGRRPIFDTRQGLWGYELFAVGGDGPLAAETAGDDSVTRQVASSSYIGLQRLSDRGRKIMVSFSKRGVLEDLLYGLPPETAVVRISEQAGAGQAMLDALDRLKRDRYLLAVADYSCDPACDLLYRMADLLCLKASALDGLVVNAARSHRAQLLAECVADRAVLETCLKLGCDLFDGPFFKAPEKLSLRKISSHQVFRLRLLELSAVDEPDFEKLADTIQSDVSVSFRLLAYLNSAAFGLPRKINSIRQAISLLGWVKIRNWLRVVILADMSQARFACELTFLSAQRGKFLELVGAQHDYWGFDPDSLFLLGLFSLLEALLNTPMSEIITYLPLEDRLKGALCREANNEYVPLLQLAECFEEADWDAGERMIRQISLDGGKVKASFQKAIAWANLATMLPEDDQPQ
jgi:EAL and modified HD-GYP domain-containing signal transduction protein